MMKTRYCTLTAHLPEGQFVLNAEVSEDMWRQWARRTMWVTLDGELLNVIPAWWVDLGLPARWWCFWQDVFNFRNPFGSGRHD